MLKSIKDVLKFSNVIEAQAITGAVSGTGVDVENGGSLTFLVSAGDFAFDGTNKLNLIVQHADVDVDGSYAAAADADIFDAEDGANGIAKVLDSTLDKETVHAIHYRGNKRYVRIRVTEGGTVDVPLSVVAIQGHLKANPAS